MKIVKLSEEYENKWNEFLNSNEKRTLYHTLEWRDIIINTYKFEPLYFLALDGRNNVKAIFPSFFVKSIFGKKIVSVPYNYYGGPLYTNVEAAKSIINHVIEEGKKRNVKYLEIKMSNPLDKKICRDLNLQAKEHYLLSTLNLSNLDEVKSKFKRLVRRQIKKATTLKGVDVRLATSLDDVKSFYNIMVDLYIKKHNTIPQPFKLLKEFWGKLIKKDMGFLLLATFNEKIVGGTLLIKYNDVLFDAWSLSKRNFSDFSPNYLLIWEAIKLGLEKKCKYLDLGVTSPNHKDLLDFKSRWGAEEIKFPFYYALINDKEIPHIDYYTSFRTIRKFIKYTPNPLMKIMSPHIVRQFS